MRPFHLAIPVTDLPAARSFYRDSLGCPEGRSSSRWIDFDLYGHQLVVHLVDAAADAEADVAPPRAANAVDGQSVPVPHFGVVLSMVEWEALAHRLQAVPGIVFDLAPQVRFRGQPSEQATMFFRDPSGNALEFKALANPDRLFARDEAEVGVDSGAER